MGNEVAWEGGGEGRGGVGTCKVGQNRPLANYPLVSEAQSWRRQNMTHQCSHERAPASAHASAHASVHESALKSWLSLCYNPMQRLPLECWVPTQVYTKWFGCVSPGLFSPALFLTRLVSPESWWLALCVLVVSFSFDGLLLKVSREQRGPKHASQGHQDATLPQMQQEPSTLLQTVPGTHAASCNLGVK